MRAKNIPAGNVPARAALQRGPNPRQRILVVEDEAAIRRINIRVLTGCGYQVDGAGDGAAAWGALQLTNYDLMVTDNDMPKVTGVELIRKIQAARMPLPVIMATGASPYEEYKRYGLSPPAMTLLKPYTFGELLAAVKKVLCAASDALEEIASSHNNWQLGAPADHRRL